jgi:methylmalonyl-CoA mutase
LSFLDKFLTQSFNTQLDQWEIGLKQELKLQDVKGRTQKSTLDNFKWPILSTTRQANYLLPNQEPWKKAAQSYGRIPADRLQSWLAEDLAGGVRAFFFNRSLLTTGQEQLIKTQLASSAYASEMNLFWLGEDEVIISGRAVMEAGGNNVQELAALTCHLIEVVNAGRQAEVQLGIFLDSHFFKNIAKIRAAKLLALKVRELMQQPWQFKTLALSNYREWTLFERYTNLLRNNAAVASGLVAGADYIQSSGYQLLFDFETQLEDLEHTERSRRLARNACHILSLESMLGTVQDSASGSYHLENLTEAYAREAWQMMQQVIHLPSSERQEFFIQAARSVQQQRQQQLHTRKQLVAGLNDFPEPHERLGIDQNLSAAYFRTGRELEKLRLAMEASEHKPKVYVAIFGDYAQLNARLSFVKNYFELLGLEVSDSGESCQKLDEYQRLISNRHEEIIVLCASDDHYFQLQDLDAGAKELFLAGKYQLPGYTNIHAGQDIYQVLSTLVQKWGRA